ncbi:MAG: VanZ family protein [Gemmatirosa sp.]
MPHASSSRPPYGRTGARLGVAVLGFVAAIVGAITLQPFRFAWPRQLAIMGWDTPFDAIANVALFVPLGFLYALTRAARTATGEPPAPAALAHARRRTLALALLGGAGASLAIEVTQLFEPGRFASPIDVATNALGALLGAWLHARAARQLGADTPLVGRLVLELPVMGLLYVSLPLCTLAAVTSAAADAPRLGGVSPRAVALLLLAVFGGALLGTVQRRQLGPAGTLAPAWAALVAAGWFLVGALPALAIAPGTLLAGGALAGGVAWDLARRAPDTRPLERRFEAEALLRAAPFFAGYLVLLPLGDPPQGADAWTRLGILRHVEVMAAFTVGGYLLAEAMGRRRLRYRHTAWRVGLAAGAAATVLAMLRVDRGAVPASLLALATHVVAAAYGGWLYHLQRAHVLALIDARRAPAAPSIGVAESTPARRSAA